MINLAILLDTPRLDSVSRTRDCPPDTKSPTEIYLTTHITSHLCFGKEILKILSSRINTLIREVNKKTSRLLVTFTLNSLNWFSQSIMAKVLEDQPASLASVTSETHCIVGIWKQRQNYQNCLFMILCRCLF